jgi:hypothetical protein
VTESPFINSFIEIGRMRARRENLLICLRARLPELLTPAVEQAIAEQSSLPLLNSWFDAALEAKSADDLLAVLWPLAAP